MKNAKKVLSVFLTLLMVMSSMNVAFAANTGITWGTKYTGPNSSYGMYQVFYDEELVYCLDVELKETRDMIGSRVADVEAALANVTGPYASATPEVKEYISKLIYFGNINDAAKNDVITYVSIQRLIWEALGAQDTRTYDQRVLDRTEEIRTAVSSLGQSLRFSVGGAYTTDTIALANPVGVGKTGEMTYTVKDAAVLRNMQYVIVNGTMLRFAVGDTAALGEFSITNNGDSVSVRINNPSANSGKNYTVRFLESTNVSTNLSHGGIVAFPAKDLGISQNFFTDLSYNPGANWIAFCVSDTAGDITLPSFQFSGTAKDAKVGYDTSAQTPRGEASLLTSWTIEINNGKRIRSLVMRSDKNGADAKTIPTQIWESLSELTNTGTEHNNAGTEYSVYSGTANISIVCSAPEGYLSPSISHVFDIGIELKIPIDSNGNFNGTPICTVNSKSVTFSDTLTVDSSTISDMAVSDTLQIAKGSVALTKYKGVSDPFSTAGTTVDDSGASYWSVRLKTDGFENHPYIVYKPIVSTDTRYNASANGYAVEEVKTTSALIADSTALLATSTGGKLIVHDLPYGTYIFEEVSNADPSVVLNSFEASITYDGQAVSKVVTGDVKENIIKIQMTDNETGRNVPFANAAFRIRYMGQPNSADPTQDVNYGRYLPNGNDINDGYEYVFNTDANGSVVLPYALTYGSYMIEEFLAPAGYYIGSYKNDSGLSEKADGTLGFYDTVAIYDSNGKKVNYTENPNVTFNYYEFDVTVQNEGEPIVLFTDITNNAVKGKVEILKRGEKLVGFTKTDTINGRGVYEPVYEQFPLSGSVFEIYSAEDIMLEDGVEPPTAYLNDGTKLPLSTVLSSNTKFPDAIEVQQAQTNDGATVTHVRQRNTGSNNLSLTEYVTPADKPVVYKLTHTAQSGLFTLYYDIEFGMEYKSNKTNYTDVKITRRAVAADYSTPFNGGAISVLNGTVPTAIADAMLASGASIKVGSTKTGGVAVSDTEAIHYSPNAIKAFMPEITSDPTAASYLNQPVLPSSYHIVDHKNRYLITNGTVDEDMVALKNANGDFDKWELVSVATDASAYLVPHFGKASFANADKIPATVTLSTGDTKVVVYQYATWDNVIVTLDTDTTQYVLVLDETGAFNVRTAGQTQTTFDAPVIPSGWTDVSTNEEFIIQNNLNKDNYMTFIIDKVQGSNRWVPCDASGAFCKEYVESASFTLAQPESCSTGFTVSFDGLVLTSTTATDKAQVTIVNPFAVEPVITNNNGATVDTTGNTTNIKIASAAAPVFFLMQDGVKVRSSFVDGVVMTEIIAPTVASIPSVYHKGNLVDYTTPLLDTGSGYCEISKNKYVRAELTGSGTNKQYNILLVDDATSDTEALELQFQDTHAAYSLVDDDTGVLTFVALHNTMRYPLGTMVDRITSDANGAAVSTELPLGDYYIREVSAPYGFVASDATYPISIEYKDQYTPLVWATSSTDNNAVSVELDLQTGFKGTNSTEFTKVKANTQFGVYAHEPISATEQASGNTQIDKTTLNAGDLVAVVTSDANGKALNTLRLPKGDYYVQELGSTPSAQVSDLRYFFRIDEESTSDVFRFSYGEKATLNGQETTVDTGVSGKVSHTGYQLAEIELVFLKQTPAHWVKVNGIRYESDTAIASRTVGNNVLIENAVEADQSVMKITGSSDKPVDIEFSDGSKMQVTIGDVGYEAVFKYGSWTPTLNLGTGINLTHAAVTNGIKVVFNPSVAYTGYQMLSETVFNAPSTMLMSDSGLSVRYIYDKAAGVRKALITYPDTVKYYTSLSSGKTPTDAILFSYVNSNGVGVSNSISAFENAVVDRGARTILVDISEAYRGEMVAAFGKEKIRFVNGTGGVTGDDFSEIYFDTASPITTYNSGSSTTDGYQKDSIYTSKTPGGKVMMQQNRVVTLSSMYEASGVESTLQYDHSFVRVLSKGTLTKVWYDGSSQSGTSSFADFRLAPGHTVVLLFNDGALYTVSLNGSGELDMDVEGLGKGGFTSSTGTAPTLYVNKSAGAFLNGSKSVIAQKFPMDETSIDGIHLVTSKSVTYSRSDGFISQLQIKLNVADNNGTAAPIKQYGGSTVKPVLTTTKMTLNKLDVSTSAGVAGATIQVKDEYGNVVTSGNTDKYGRFTFTKPVAGTYTFNETVAPDGYILNETVYRFVVSKNGTVTGDDTIENTPSDSVGNPKVLALSVKDATTKKGIAGVRIEIKDSAGVLIASDMTNTKGNLVFPTLPPAGKYYFKQMSTADGYFINNAVHEFTVDGTGHVTDGSTTIYNVPSEVVIRKIDGANKTAVEGATIEVYDASGNVIYTGLTDKNGLLFFNAPALGTYLYKETAAPDGYTLSTETFSFTLCEDGTIDGSLEFVNHAITPQTGVTDMKWVWIGAMVFCMLIFVSCCCIKKRNRNKRL